MMPRIPRCSRPIVWSAGVSRLRSLYPFARPYVARILLSLVITIAFTVFGILPPLVMRFFVDKVIEHRDLSSRARGFGHG